MAFLKEPELEKYSEPMYKDFVEQTVGFRDGKFAYRSFSPSSPTGDGPAPGDDNAEADSMINGNGFSLSNLNVEFPVGKLSVVCGATGAGKSSLVLSLLGELKRIKGTYMLPDPRASAMLKPDPTGIVSNCVSYVAQTAWMLNATVRDNILFGRPFDSERYWRVIEACALKRDLETLDAGDMTEVCE